MTERFQMEQCVTTTAHYYHQMDKHYIDMITICND